MSNRSVHIIMPMAGFGTRTSDRYDIPKPLIHIFDKHLFEIALEGFKEIAQKHNFKITMIVRDSNNYYNDIFKKAGNNFPNVNKFNFVVIDKPTRGSLETVMKAENLIDDNDICVILDCDLMFRYYKLNGIIERIDNDIDGFLMSFDSDSNKYSYAAINNDNIVSRTAEKNPISTHALAGVYGFASGKILKQYARKLLNQPPELKEYYVSAIYNHMIKDGAKIILNKLDEYASLGTSDEIELYKNFYNRNKQLFITDFDGTLFDTRYANFLAYRDTFKEVCNYTLTSNEYYNCFGLRINELLEKLEIPLKYLEDIRKVKAQIYKKYFDKIQINIMLLCILKQHKANGSAVALATTASRENVMNILKLFELENFFDYIITGEDVEQSKPSPEVYNKIIGKYSDVALDNITIYEDSEVGLTAGYRSMASNVIDVVNRNLIDWETLKDYKYEKDRSRRTFGM